MAWWWAALLVLSASFIGSFVGSAWGSYPRELTEQPKPRHPKQDEQPFPVDLDELDRRHRGHGKDEL